MRLIKTGGFPTPLRFAGRDEPTIGSLEVDKKADILIIDAPDYHHRGYRFGGNLVKTVVKSGRVVVDR